MHTGGDEQMANALPKEGFVRKVVMESAMHRGKVCGYAFRDEAGRVSNLRDVSAIESKVVSA